jgi:hypothetical protein
VNSESRYNDIPPVMGGLKNKVKRRLIVDRIDHYSEDVLFP